MNRKDFLTAPNLVSMFRLAMAPLCFILLYLEKYGNQAGVTRGYCIAAAAVFLVAALSDIVDGYLARKYSQITDIGKFLDPLADKVLVTTALVLLVSLGRCPAWIALVIILREIIITGLRGIAQTGGETIAASQLGKRKTVFQNIALVGLLLHYHYNIAWFLGTHSKFWFVNMHRVGMVFVYIAVFYTLYSGYDYLAKFIRKTAN
jgi:CDP-diacylglycerol--glycerol-3-phosphate 3-phosphatidyltransferase